MRISDCGHFSRLFGLARVPRRSERRLFDVVTCTPTTPRALVRFPPFLGAVVYCHEMNPRIVCIRGADNRARTARLIEEKLKAHVCVSFVRSR